MSNTLEITQEQLKKLQSCTIFFALPCYGGVLYESFFMSFLKTVASLSKLGINIAVDTIVNESLIPRGRNSLVAKMMYGESNTHLIFIDVDIGFDDLAVIKLLLADKDIVGGLYPKKSLPISYVVNAVEKPKHDSSLLQVRHIGTGFMCIKREVFTKMFEFYQDLKYKTDIGLGEQYDDFTYALFDTVIDPETRDYLSEDYTFCDRWSKIGGEIWADTSLVLDHSGHYKFQGRGLTKEELETSIKQSTPNAEI